MSWSNYAETLIETFMLTNGTATRPTVWYVSLHTADPTDAALATEVSGGAYQRQSATFSAPSGGATSNSGPLTFPTATANWGTVTHVGIWDALSAGNLLKSGALAASAAVNTGTTYSLPASQVSSSTD